MHRGILSVGILLASISTSLGCGTERWAVKTGTDRDASGVNTFFPQMSTIAGLSAIGAPPNPNSRASSRFTPTELNSFTISGILTVIKKEKDEDYHLVVVDPNNSKLHMIVESPHPHCAVGSRFLQQIANVRQTIDQQFGSFRRKAPNIQVTVTGVAFFDPIHGQEGVAPNGVELHPLLAIEFHQTVPTVASKRHHAKTAHRGTNRRTKRKTTHH
jgi:hypothetical protein